MLTDLEAAKGGGEDPTGLQCYTAMAALGGRDIDEDTTQLKTRAREE